MYRKNNKIIKTLLLITIISVILSLTSTAITIYDTNISYVPQIRFKDNIANACGYCYLSGIIVISKNPNCDQEKTLLHELRHAKYFRALNKTEQISYCKQNKMKYGRECWEHYANNAKNLIWTY